MRKLLGLIAVVSMVFYPGCAKSPDSGAFLSAWKVAVGKKDTSSLWNLTDQDSRRGIIARLEQGRARAGSDNEFKQLFAALNPAIESSLAPEAMAKRAMELQLDGAFDPNIAINLKGDDAVLVWHQESARLHVEDGQWRVAIGVVGFALPDGTPVTLAFSWPVPPRTEKNQTTPGKPLPAPASGNDGGQVISSVYFETNNGHRRALIEMPDTIEPALSVVRTEKDSRGGDISKMSESELDAVLADNRLVPDALEGFHVHIDPNGLTVDEMKAGYLRIAQRISRLANLPDTYADQAARLMVYYENVVFADGPEDKPFDVEFAVEVGGSLTATHWVFSRANLSKAKNVHPRLAFTARSAAP